MSENKNKIERLITIIFTLALIALIIVFFKPFSAGNRIESLQHITVSAGRMMERHLNFYNNYDSVTIYEKAIHEFLFGTREQVQMDILNAYDEVLDYYSDTVETEPWKILNIRTRRLITIAETGTSEQLQAELEQFNHNFEEEIVAELVRYAYIPDKHAEFEPAISAGLDLIPNGWAKDHLIFRLSSKHGNVEYIRFYGKKIDELGKEQRGYVLALVITIAILTFIGLIFILNRSIFHRASPWTKSVLNNPWSLSNGYSVAVRSAVYGLSITVLLYITAAIYPQLIYIAIFSTFFASLPMLYLIKKRLLPESENSLMQAFGLTLSRKTFFVFLSITLSLLALQWIGNILISWGSWKLGMTSHWSSHFHEQLVFGSELSVWLSAINIVILVPIFEEIGFRGLLYTSLIKRFSTTTAIVISSFIFSAMHIASFPTFLSLFWSGLILAYSFHRFNSLLPGIMIHSAGNLLNIGTSLLFYR